MVEMAQMMVYYVFAREPATPAKPGDVIWPYEVALCFESVRRPVGFAEGSGMCSSSGLFTAAEALTATWSEHIALAQAQWLLPALRDMAAGRAPDREALFAHYFRLHGHEPAMFEIALDII